jgi:hypothetical protein
MLFVVESGRRGLGVAYRTLGPGVRWVLVPWGLLAGCLADPGLASFGVLCRK